MNVRRAVLLSSTALVGALLVPAAGIATATATAQATSTPLQASYTCKISFWLLPGAEPFPMDLDADVSALRTGPAVQVTMTMGKPVLDLDDPLENVGLSTDLRATVDGRSTTLVGSGTVSFLPATPVDLPALETTVTTPATSLPLTLGALTLTVDYANFEVPINCTLDSPVSVTVPVVDPNAPAPTPTPTPTPTQDPAPAPAPVAKRAPVLKVSLTKKTQKFRKAPAKVKVSLKRAKQNRVAPRGTVVVKAGKRTVAKVQVKGPKSFKVSLPRNLKPGRHKVKVTFTPKKGTSHKKVSRSVKLRVKR